MSGPDASAGRVRSGETMRALTGAVAAAVTPMREDGALALDAVGTLVEHLVGGGVGGIMVGGTTGEFIALSVAERAQLTRAFVEAADGRVPVIAHVGHVDRREVLRLTEDAAAAGAAATTALTPYYHPASARAIEHAFREAAQAAEPLPFFVYNFPAASGNRLPVELFQRLLDEPNLVGVKVSASSWEELAPYVALVDEVCVLSGNDSLMPRFVAHGGRAVVSGNAAAFPDVVSAALGGLRAGDDVDRWQPVVDDLSGLSRSGSPDRLKALLAERGVDVGPGRVRTHLPEDVDHEADEQRWRRLQQLPMGLQRGAGAGSG